MNKIEQPSDVWPTCPPTQSLIVERYPIERGHVSKQDLRLRSCIQIHQSEGANLVHVAEWIVELVVSLSLSFSETHICFKQTKKTQKKKIKNKFSGYSRQEHGSYNDDFDPSVLWAEASCSSGGSGSQPGMSTSPSPSPPYPSAFLFYVIGNS